LETNVAVIVKVVLGIVERKTTFILKFSPFTVTTVPGEPDNGVTLVILGVGSGVGVGYGGIF
jgi:hypothetical protein